MISGLILLYAWLEYKKDCKEIGKDNLVVSWNERLFAWMACGFWSIDLILTISIINIIKYNLF